MQRGANPHAHTTKGASQAAGASVERHSGDSGTQPLVNASTRSTGSVAVERATRNRAIHVWRGYRDWQ